MAESLLRVDLGERSYDIVIGKNLLEPGSLDEYLKPHEGPCWIVTDEIVAHHHLDRAVNALKPAGSPPSPIVVPAGEHSKTFSCLENVVRTVLEGRPERSSTLYALGGGVVGDLAGFAASMVLRGIRLIQIPTTLLAQVDSSVGGKTGINTRHGKNLVGAFYQPSLVVAELDLLQTLPRRQWLAGYAEVVKYGLIGDVEFFEWLETGGPDVVSGDEVAWRHAVHASCAAKAAIVGHDEREAENRALLNFGHTFGHAFETEAGFGNDLLHGEAVAIGMIMAFELSAALGLCPRSDVDRVRRHFRNVGLPLELPSVAGLRWDPEGLIAHMKHDKKVRDGQVSFILTRGIGHAFIAREVDMGAVRSILEEARPA